MIAESREGPEKDNAGPICETPAINELLIIATPPTAGQIQNHPTQNPPLDRPAALASNPLIRRLAVGRARAVSTVATARRDSGDLRRPDRHARLGSGPRLVPRRLPSCSTCWDDENSARHATDDGRHWSTWPPCRWARGGMRDGASGHGGTQARRLLLQLGLAPPGLETVGLCRCHRTQPCRLVSFSL